MSANTEVEYLCKQHIPDIVDTVMLRLVKNQPITPLKWLAHETALMEKQGIHKEPEVVFVLGGPGSGKGTQCARLVEEFGCLHLSAGELLRGEVQSGSEQGKQIQDIMLQGGIVPGHITIALLKKTILLHENLTWVLVDGFPRELGQALEFEHAVGYPAFVLCFSAPDSILRERLLNRSLTSGRSDDNDATITKRLHCFHSQTEPVLEYYRATGRLEDVDASGSVEQIAENVRPIFCDKKLCPKIVFVLGGPGSGKGTMCARIVAKYNCLHFSSGDLLRDEVRSGSALGKSLEDAMKKGQLVDSEIVFGLLRRAVCNISPQVPFILLDGYPREMIQALEFEEKIVPCAFALSFTAPDEILVQRLLGRGLSSGRADDNINTIKLRLETFHKQSEAVIEYFKAVDRLCEVDGSKSADAVWESLVPLLEKYFE